MKKIRTLAMVACVALMTACGGPTSPTEKAKDYARRIREAKGNQTKVMQIHREANKYANDLSATEKEKFYDELGKALGY